MTVTNKRSLIALLISLVLVVSLFTVGISATDGETSTGTTVETSATTEVASETESGTESSSETTTTTGTSASDEAKNEAFWTLIKNAIIMGVIILIAVILIIRFRKKLGSFLRSVKSERKKVVWSSKENTKKSFLVVIVIAIAVAVLLWIVDLAFSTGLGMLHNAFSFLK